jgi:hypothetical protein
MDKKIKQIQENRRKIKKDIYTEIYSQFSRRILIAVENNHPQIFLTVPEFLVGHPIYDRTKATAYIKRQLENGKFKVMQVNEYELYISFAKTKTKTKRETKTPEEDDETGFPTLVNLRKAANKLR